MNKTKSFICDRKNYVSAFASSQLNPVANLSHSELHSVILNRNVWCFVEKNNKLRAINSLIDLKLTIQQLCLELCNVHKQNNPTKILTYHVVVC